LCKILKLKYLPPPFHWQSPLDPHTFRSLLVPKKPPPLSYNRPCLMTDPRRPVDQSDRIFCVQTATLVLVRLGNTGFFFDMLPPLFMPCLLLQCVIVGIRQGSGNFSFFLGIWLFFASVANQYKRPFFLFFYLLIFRYHFSFRTRNINVSDSRRNFKQNEPVSDSIWTKI
jgi:hypothetical protein